MMNELHSLRALRQAADYLRAKGRHRWADTIMAAIETLTRDDNTAEAIERVRALHQETVYDSFWATDRYCRECSNDWPCPTIQALDGSADPEPVDPVLDENDKRDRIDSEGDRWCWWGDAEAWRFTADYIRGNLAVIDRHYGPLRFANEDDEETDE